MFLYLNLIIILHFVSFLLLLHFNVRHQCDDDVDVDGICGDDDNCVGVDDDHHHNCSDDACGDNDDDDDVD